LPRRGRKLPRSHSIGFSKTPLRGRSWRLAVIHETSSSSNAISLETRRPTSQKTQQSSARGSQAFGRVPSQRRPLRNAQNRSWALLDDGGRPRGLQRGTHRPAKSCVCAAISRRDALGILSRLWLRSCSPRSDKFFVNR